MLTKNEEDAGSCHENEPNLEYLTCQLCSLSLVLLLLYSKILTEKKKEKGGDRTQIEILDRYIYIQKRSTLSKLSLQHTHARIYTSILYPGFKPTQKTKEKKNRNVEICVKTKKKGRHIE